MCLLCRRMEAKCLSKENCAGCHATRTWTIYAHISWMLISMPQRVVSQCVLCRMPHIELKFEYKGYWMKTSLDECSCCKKNGMLFSLKGRMS